MTASGRYASPDSSFGRSAGNAAARGGALIAVAVVIGLLLLWKGGVGGSGSAAEVTGSDTAAADSDAAADTADQTGDVEEDFGDGQTDDASTDGDGTADADVGTDSTVPETTETVPTVVTRPPGEVRAAVANATGEAGLAGARSGDLATAGYVTAAVNALADTAVSNVFYIDGYGPDAEQVAIVLGADASVLRVATAAEIAGLVAESSRADVDGFHVLAVLGTDRALG